MTLQWKGFSQLVRDMTATLQGSATSLIDVSAGSVLRAVFEANASVALWLQWLLLQVLQTTRAATSVDADLDSWMADFGLQRLPATSATGLVTFSRFATTLPATIPPGTIVKTTDGSLSFMVTVDASQSTWQPNSNGYIVPAGIPSVSVPVACMTVGSSGNVLAGAISVIASSLPGVDQISNAAPMTNGMDRETDEALRSRFRGYLASLSRATPQAIRVAAESVQQNLQLLIQENVAGDGSISPGRCTITIDDGSGYPPSALLSAVTDAIEAVRPIGTQCTVMAPVVRTVNVQMAATLPSTVNASAAVTAIEDAVAEYLNSLPIGAIASITRIAQKAYEAAPEVLYLSAITLDRQTGDVAPPQRGVVKAGVIGITINAG